MLILSIVTLNFGVSDIVYTILYYLNYLANPPAIFGYAGLTDNLNKQVAPISTLYLVATGCKPG
jgi:hypothetical protein